MMTILRVLLVPTLSALLMAATLSACAVEHSEGHTSVAPAAGFYYHNSDD